MKRNDPLSIKPQVTKKGILLVILFWIGFTLLSAGLLTNANEVPFIYSITGMALSNFVLLLYMIAAWFLIVRELHYITWPLKLILHTLTGVAITFLWYYSFLGLFDILVGLERMNSEFMDSKAWILFNTFTEYAIVFAVIHVIESMKNLRSKEKQSAELKELSRKQEIATLKAQINPHFLFNTLNGINAAIIQDHEKAQQMVARLSEMLRYSLDNFGTDLVPLAHELSFVKTYLKLEKIRLGDRLRVRFEIQDGLAQIQVPPMICQPLAENAIKHGISSLEEGGSVAICVQEESGFIRFSIEDDGAGISDEKLQGKQLGIGLHNTNEMLTKRYGKESALRIEKNEPRGTKVSFKIPADI